MTVKIVVSAEELIKTMEYVSLISGTVSSKKKNDGIVPAYGSMKITAVSPKKDKKYLLIFECIGMAEQLIYRMEGRSYYSDESASAVVDVKSFMTLTKTFSNDIEIVFEGKYMGINSGTSNYRIPISSIELPKLELPKDRQKIVLSVDFLVNAYRFCSVACARDAKRGAVFQCLQINLQADGSAVCYATDSHKLARYVNEKAGSHCQCSFLMVSNSVAHITEMCDDNELNIIPTEKAIFVTTPRFDYCCYAVSDNLPNCGSLFEKFKPLKTIYVERGKLQAAVSRAMVFSDDTGSMKITFASDDSNIYISSDSAAGSGLDSVPLNGGYEGVDDKGHNVSGIGFSRLLSGCGSDNISISTASPLSPVMIKIPDTQNSYILSAMR